MVVGDSFTFTIRGTLPNGYTSDFTFTLSIVASLTACYSISITPPTVSN
jgi:hypothetical protein